ncbi:MAG: ATP-binding protein, partial [Chitinivibrionales bacterium]
PYEVLGYYNDLGEQLYVNGRRRDVFLTMLKNKGVVRNFELQAWKKDGSKIWASMDARLSYDENGGRVIDGFIQDITSHKRTLDEKMEMEKRIRHNEKIDAIGKLSGGIAHDFNNILGGIIGYTEMALDDVEPGSRSERNLNKVLSASERAKQLVKQILSFSRQSEKVLSPTYLRPVVKEALEFMRASIPSSINLTSYLEREKKPVMANSGQIHEIIVNLCTNAVDSIGEKGRIHIRLTTKEWEPENGYRIAPGSYACLSVSDNGCGMDSVMQEHIFEPFYTSKEQGKGTGLGLSVVHGIVKEHYGHIFVESEKEKGSTFTMYFMKTDLPVGKARQEDKGIELGGDERVMLVDDEPMITEMFSDILTKLGYTVTPYNSSERALDAFINDPEGYDVMITDQTMPELTGIELTELVHSKRDDLPVILCTGYSNTLDREAAINRGVTDFSMKPLKPGDLASIIRRVLDKRLQG